MANGRIFLYGMHSGTASFLPEEVRYSNIFCGDIDADGNVWIGSEYGIYVLDRCAGEVIAHYEHSFDSVCGLNDTPTYSILRDRNDNMWVGTYFGGINCWIHGTDAFRTYPYGDHAGHLGGKAVRHIIADRQGGLLLATEDGGLNRLDADRRVVSPETVRRSTGIDELNIHYLKYASDGSLLAGSFLHGVFRCTPGAGRPLHYPTANGGISSGFFIHECPDGRIFYAWTLGMFMIDAKGDGKARKISNIGVFCGISESDTTVLLGKRRDGIMRMNVCTREVEHIDVPFLRNQYVSCLLRDSRGLLWVGTNTDGLCVLDSDFSCVKTSDEFRFGSNCVMSLAEDRDGRI